MKEIITLQVGQCGNQIGWRFWDLLQQEHSAAGLDDPSMTTFFSPRDSRLVASDSSSTSINGLLSRYRARAVLLDMEEGVVSQLLRSPIGPLFDTHMRLTDVSGAGNNWACGYAEYGPSLGGGTGSGFGSFILEQLADYFPEQYRFTASLMPAKHDDVITSPYNALLSTARLIDCADAVMPVDNQCLIDIVNTVNKQAKPSEGSVVSLNRAGKGGSAGTSASTASRSTLAAAASSSSSSGSASSSSSSSSSSSAADTDSSPIPEALQKMLAQADAVLESVATGVTIGSAAAASSSASSRIAGAKAGSARGGASATASGRPGSSEATRAAASSRGSGSTRGGSAAVATSSSARRGIGASASGPSAATSSVSSILRGGSSARPPRGGAAAISAVRGGVGGGVGSAATSAAKQSPSSLPAAAGGLPEIPARQDTPLPSSASDEVVDVRMPRAAGSGGGGGKKAGGSPFDAMNNLVANMLSNLTASMRFSGTLNVDINEITSTMVPFPRLHFLSTSLTPLVGTGVSASGGGSMSGSGMRIADSRLCDRIVSQGFGNSNLLVDVDFRTGLHLASGILLRGPFAISDVNAAVLRQQRELKMVSWNPDGFKIGLCTSPPLYSEAAGLVISNNTSIRNPLAEGYSRFLRLYRAQAHVHHYLEYIEASQFQQAAEAVTSLIADYDAQE